jgi:hypothetical protein
MRSQLTRIGHRTVRSSTIVPLFPGCYVRLVLVRFKCRYDVLVRAFQVEIFGCDCGSEIVHVLCRFLRTVYARVAPSGKVNRGLSGYPVHTCIGVYP